MSLQTMPWQPTGVGCTITLQYDNSLANPTHTVLAVQGSTAPYPALVLGETLEGSAFLTAWLANQPAAIPPILGNPGTMGIFDFPSLSAGQTNFPILAGTFVTGLFRLTGFFRIVTPATTSSTLGPMTVACTLNDGTTLSMKMGFLNSVGDLTTTNATNSVSSTGVMSLIPFTFYAKTGMSITVTLTYASSGATTMKYEAHFRLESL